MKRIMFSILWAQWGQAPLRPFVMNFNLSFGLRFNLK